MVGWHHILSGHELEQTLGNNEGQTGKLRMLEFMGLQRIGHDLVTEQQQQKEAKDLYSETCKILMKEIKHGTNTWRDIS